MASFDVGAAMANYHTKQVMPAHTETINQFLNRLYHTGDTFDTVAGFFKDIEAVNKVAAQSDGFRWHCTYTPYPSRALHVLC